MRHQLYRLTTALTVKAITDKAVEREFVRVTGGAGGLLSMLTGHAAGETQSPWTATGIMLRDGKTTVLTRGSAPKCSGFNHG